MKKCPKVSRPVASSMKGFISESIKSVSYKNSQHKSFLPIYKNLMSCFDHLDTLSHNPGKRLQSAQSPNDETRKILEAYADLMKSPEEQRSDDDDEKANEWNPNWTEKVGERLDNLSREKRSSHSYSFRVAKRVGIKSVESPADAQMNFIKMVQQLHSIVQNTCRDQFSLDTVFSIKALAQIVDSISKDKVSLVRASHKYFGDNQSILDELNECL
jgi:hypothetical protein